MPFYPPYPSFTAVILSSGMILNDSGCLPRYRGSHVDRYHPYPRRPRQDQDRLLITVNPCGRLEIAYAGGMELETRIEGPSTACGTMRSDPLESPYDHDFPIVGHEDFFGPHANWQQDAETQPTRATAKVAAAFVNMLYKLRRRYLALIAVAHFLTRGQ
ncbi:hypothetical protein C8Q76DRAFT_691917 [Earliella scabrosa]|nr:hypothetical protein C8Q76DRAFT_691917 [Earliella scabrosa]